MVVEGKVSNKVRGWGRRRKFKRYSTAPPCVPPSTYLQRDTYWSWGPVLVQVIGYSGR